MAAVTMGFLLLCATTAVFYYGASAAEHETMCLLLKHLERKVGTAPQWALLRVALLAR